MALSLVLCRHVETISPLWFNNKSLSVCMSSSFSSKRKLHFAAPLWTILSRASAYQSGAAKCNLRLEEKLLLIQTDKDLLLNQRGEIVSTCRHKTKLRAMDFHRRRKKNNIP